MIPNDSQSDIAALWEKALDRYCEVSKVNVRREPSFQRSIADIQKEQEHQLDTFKEFRHNKGKVDRLRSVIRDNVDFIQKIAGQVANAASLAFPPSTVILTALTYVITASKHVSDDYNMIECFFDLMRSFFLRLSLLEGRILPTRKELQQHLMEVFSSILNLLGITQSYCANGRLKAWVSALAKSRDPALQEAYASLHKHLKRLESAVMLQTLRTAIDIHEKTKSIDEGIVSLQESLDKNTAIALTNKSTSLETLDVVKKILVVVNPQRDETKQKNPENGPLGKPPALVRLKELLSDISVKDMLRRQQELAHSSVSHLFDWIETDPSVLDIINNKERLLWVSGASGMGKSTVAYKLFCHLKKSLSDDPSVCVAYHFFDQDFFVTRSIRNMVKWCCIMAAESDARYCEEALRDLRNRPPTNQDGKVLIDDDLQRLMESKYSKDSKRRLVLVLDGVDEALTADLDDLIALFGRVKDRSCEVQLVITSDLSVEERLSPVATKRIELTLDKISADLRHFALSQVESLPRLKRLKTRFRKSLAKKVSAKADSFHYVAHTMRRLNGIGYAAPILRELKDLPANTTVLYDALLNDCLKNRSPEEVEILRGLLAWIGHAYWKISVRGAKVLINVLKKNLISIDEAFEGPLARLLRISGGGDGDADDVADSDSSRSWTEQPDSESDSAARITGDATDFIYFRDRSLRAYFCKAEDEPHSLRCTSTQAHVVIFRVICAILTRGSKYADGYSIMSDLDQLQAQGGLAKYAAERLFEHLYGVEVEGISDEIAAKILKGLFDVFGNYGNCLRYLEPFGDDKSTVLDAFWEEAIYSAKLVNWAKRAIRLPPGLIPTEVVEWYRPLADDPRRVFISLARAHIKNWFSALTIFSAYVAFLRAYNALLKCQDFPEIQQNAVLQDYLREFEKNGQEISETSFEAISNAFQDIDKSCAAYLGISRAMVCKDLYQGAINQLDLALNTGKLSDVETIRFLASKGYRLYDLAGLAEKEEDKAKYFHGTVHNFDAAIELYHRIEAAGVLTEVDRARFPDHLGTLAEAAAQLGKFDLVLGNVKDAANSKLGAIDFNTLDGIISLLVKAKEYGKVMEVLDVISKALLNEYLQRISYAHLASFVNSQTTGIQKAAKRSGGGSRVLDMYKVAAKATASDPVYKSSVQLMAASFARRAMADTETPKELLLEVIHDPQAQYGIIRLAGNWLAELLFEDFRLSTDATVMNSALQEMKRLQNTLAVKLGNDFKPEETTIAVKLALMLRKLGPALELAQVLQSSFLACERMLTDETGNNDFTALRQLARVLSCVKGLEREAQVAHTAQFYILDRDIHEKDLAEQRRSEGKEADKESLQPEPSTPAGGAGGASNRITVEDEPLTIANQLTDDPEEDFIQFELYCDICREQIKNWKDRGAYLCLYCHECDICEECLAKMGTRKGGESEPPWQVLCPQGHRRVRAPVEGWKGVSDGKLRIGDEETPFKVWLEDVKTKWNVYWEIYWQDKDL